MAVTSFSSFWFLQSVKTVPLQKTKLCLKLNNTVTLRTALLSLIPLFCTLMHTHTHTHTQLNKVIQHQFNHYTHKQKHLGIQSGKHGLILPCFSEKKCKRLKPGKKIHESRILADYLWVLLLLVIIFCISTQRGRKSATGAASIPSDLEWIASLFKQVTLELNFPTVASLSKDKGMKTNKEVPWSKGDAELPHTFMDIFSLIWNSGLRPRLLHFLPPCNSRPSDPRHSKKTTQKGY